MCDQAVPRPNDDAKKDKSSEKDEIQVEIIRDVRICTVGGPDSGKSTLIGVLVSGQLDNGRGLARSKVFVHKHEEQSGRTSCISQHIMGYDSKGEPVHQPVAASASGAQKKKSWNALVAASSSILTFVDLAGHEAYLKTTISGLTGCFPDYAVIIINSLQGVSKMTREHFGLLLALNIPFIVIITKVDMCPPHVLEQSESQMMKVLKSQHARKLPIMMKDEAKDFKTYFDNIESNRICPIFLVSTVNGQNIQLLTRFLGRLPSRRQDTLMSYQPIKTNDLTTCPCEYFIDDTFIVAGIGLVVSGTTMAGVLYEEQQLLLGPHDKGEFRPVTIKSIEIRRVHAKECRAGTSCALALRMRGDVLKRSDIRRGMWLVDPKVNPRPSQGFESKVHILHHPTTIKTQYQSVIHAGLIRQTASITHISKECLRTGDQALVKFRFMQRPEYMHVGTVFLFREGTTKGIGTVTRLLYDDSEFTVGAGGPVTEDAKKTEDVKTG